MARTPFQPIIKRARFSDRGISAQTMLGIAETVRQSIFARLDRAQDIHDSQAPPLTPKYAGYKSRPKRFGWIGAPIRDLKASGRTRRGIKVIQAGINYAIIGFTDPEALLRIKANKSISVQWGMSPVNERVFEQAVQETLERPVVVEQLRVG